MNESLYAQAIYKRLGKIGKPGMKMLDTGWLDGAFGFDEARRKLMLDRMGAARDQNNRQMNISERRLGLQEDAMRSESRDALAADVITAGSIPVSYIQGQTAAKENARRLKDEEETNLALRQYYSRMGG